MIMDGAYQTEGEMVCGIMDMCGSERWLCAPTLFLRINKTVSDIAQRGHIEAHKGRKRVPAFRFDDVLWPQRGEVACSVNKWRDEGGTVDESRVTGEGKLT